MRNFLILFSGLILFFKAEAQSIEVNGSVSGTWQDLDTVRVTGDIFLEEGNTLEIHPGILVEFQGSYSFYIGGRIVAGGVAWDYIRFDIHDTTGFATDSLSRGGWNGIQFYYTADDVEPSLFNYCQFRHGKAVSPDSLECQGGCFNIRSFSQVLITNCIFEDNFARYNGGAIYLAEGSDILVSDCYFGSNRCGPAEFPYGYGGAVCSDDSGPLIWGNIFEFNASTGVGGAVAIRFRDARVHGNTFSGNYSALGGALGYLHYYEFPHSQCNNLIYNNEAAFFGGGIANIDAGPTFVNNTITENYSTYGGGIYSKDSIVPNYYNTILWGNTAAVGPQAYFWDAYASANFYYCDVQGGIAEFGGSGGGGGYLGTYEYNLETDPLFEDSFGPYSLGFESPCIDAGTPDTTGLNLPPYDINGFHRIWCWNECIVDMGCYEMWWEGVPGYGLKSTEILVYPNPSQGIINIEIDVPRAGIYTLAIADLAGRLVGGQDLTLAREGRQKTNLNVNLCPGTYILRLLGVNHPFSASEIMVLR
jgi:predicted outer membrane repeat protein